MATNQTNHQWSLSQWRAPLPPDRAQFTKDHAIDLLGRAADFQCCLLGRLGFAITVIAARTGLSAQQVGRRLRKAGIKVKDYRRGHGIYARIVLERTGQVAARELTEDLRRRLTHATQNE
jgi:hypothetical protein